MDDEIQSPGVFLSIREAAIEFERDRDTITKKIAVRGLQTSEKRNGFLVYRLRDLIQLERLLDDGAGDPDKLPAFERHAHYKAESEKLRVDLERGELVRREDVEREWARVLKLVALEIDTIVDQVERDIGATPLVLGRIEQQVDLIRERMYAGVISDDDEEEDPPEGVGGAAAPSPA